MASWLRWVLASLLVFAMSCWASSEDVGAKDRQLESGIPLHTILEFETTARLLAILLDSGRNVINEDLVLLDEKARSEKDFTPDIFERQLVDIFRSRSGIDLLDLEAARIPARAKRLLKGLIFVSKQVVAEAQTEINRRGGITQEFIPAIFGARVVTDLLNGHTCG